MNIVFGKTHCEIDMRHLDYGQIIGGVRYAPSGILKLIEMGRAVSNERLRQVCESAQEKHNNMFFVKWQQIEIFPSFYKHESDPDVPFKHIHSVNWKTKMLHFILPIGNTSRPAENWIFDSKTGVPVTFSSVLIVNVNPETRRPMAFSKILKDHSHATNRSKTSENIKIQRLPPSCNKEYKMPEFVVSHTVTTKISVRSVDRNGHANQSVYGDICYDCLADAILKKVFFLSGSIFDYKIRRMSFLYLRECTLGDNIDTTVWQDGNHYWKFKFHLKKDGNVVCQAEFEFYPELKTKL